MERIAISGAAQAAMYHMADFFAVRGKFIEETSRQEQKAAESHKPHASREQFTSDAAQGRRADKIIGGDQGDHPAQNKQEQPQHDRGHAPHTKQGMGGGEPEAGRLTIIIGIHLSSLVLPGRRSDDLYGIAFNGNLVAILSIQYASHVPVRDYDITDFNIRLLSALDSLGLIEIGNHAIVFRAVLGIITGYYRVHTPPEGLLRLMVQPLGNACNRAILIFEKRLTVKTLKLVCASHGKSQPFVNL